MPTTDFVGTATYKGSDLHFIKTGNERKITFKDGVLTGVGIPGPWHYNSDKEFKNDWKPGEPDEDHFDDRHPSNVAPDA